MTKRFLYVTYMNDKINGHYVIKMDLELSSHLTKYFDIKNIFDVNESDLTKYDLVLFNQVYLIPVLTYIKKEKMLDAFKILKNCNLAILMHDLHDASLHLDDVFLKNNVFPNDNFIQLKKSPNYNEYISRRDELDICVKPNLEFNDAKQVYKDFFKEFNVKYLISLYDCPEYDFFYTQFKCIKKFFIVNHGYCPNIFKPIVQKKNFDVLYFGSDNEKVYPFRKRLYNICKHMGLKVDKLEYAVRDLPNKKKSEEELAKRINSAWLCIACISNFSYLVRKYFEISACNTLVLGDINAQGKDIFYNNMVDVNMEMTDKEIIQTIKYHLSNKHIILNKIKNNHINLKNYTNEKVADNINQIAKSIVSSSSCDFEYNIVKNKLNNINNKKDILYVNYTNDKVLKNFFASRIDIYMKKYLLEFADIASILDLDKICLENYKLIILNSICILPGVMELNKKIIFRKIAHLKKHNNVAFLLHDLHDYSLQQNVNYLIKYNIIKDKNGKEISIPNLGDNDAKKEYFNFFKEYNIKYLISIYDCPEYDFFYKYFKNINRFYIINHGVDPQIFKPMDEQKEYDVLFYGCASEKVYPLRTKILNICLAMNIKTKVLDYVAGDSDNNKQSEEVLCKYINRSKLCIACISNFSYFVRKYLEISACNSLVIGNINHQGRAILGDNLVYSKYYIYVYI